MAIIHSPKKLRMVSCTLCHFFEVNIVAEQKQTLVNNFVFCKFTFPSILSLTPALLLLPVFYVIPSVN